MKMTIEEAKKMVGTEFTYEYEDGDTIRAYIKKFDPEIGLTCLTLDTETERDGWMPEDKDIMEEDGTWCVVGVDFDVHTLVEAIEDLLEIKNIGKLKSRGGSFFNGCAF